MVCASDKKNTFLFHGRSALSVLSVKRLKTQPSQSSERVC
jgi:hypothetical protein